MLGLALVFALPRGQPRPTWCSSPSTPSVPTTWEPTATPRATRRPSTVWPVRACSSRTRSYKSPRLGLRTSRSSPAAIRTSTGSETTLRLPSRPAVPTLASLLRKQGYTTAAFIGAYPVSRSSGLDQGFSSFDDPYGSGEASTTDDPRLERPAGQVVDAALAWLGRRPPGPFFAWVHLFDPHHPYLPPEPYRQRFAKSPYDGEVAYADAQLGRLVAWLDAQGLRQQTLVVVTSDHGEGLGDHGEDQHLLFLYDSTLKVPAFFSWPGHLPAGARGQWPVPEHRFRGHGTRPPGSSRGGRRAAAAAPQRSVPAVAFPTTSRTRRASMASSTSAGPRCAPFAARGGSTSTRPARSSIGSPRTEESSRTSSRSARRSRRGCARVSPPTTRAGRQTAALAAPGDPAAAERLAALGYVGGGFFQGSPPEPTRRTRSPSTSPTSRRPCGPSGSTAIETWTVPCGSSSASRRSSVTETGETAELQVLQRRVHAGPCPPRQEALRGGGSCISTRPSV